MKTSAKNSLRFDYNDQKKNEQKKKNTTTTTSQFLIPPRSFFSNPSRRESDIYVNLVN